MPVRAVVGISPNGAEVWLILVFPLLLEKAAIDEIAVDMVGKTVMTRNLDCEYGFTPFRQAKPSYASLFASELI